MYSPAGTSRKLKITFNMLRMTDSVFAILWRKKWMTYVNVAFFLRRLLVNNTQGEGQNHDDRFVVKMAHFLIEASCQTSSKICNKIFQNTCKYRRAKISIKMFFFLCSFTRQQCHVWRNDEHTHTHTHLFHACAAKTFRSGWRERCPVL